MNDGLRGLADLNRVIHEPSRLIIVALLSAVEEADFVYLRNETGLTTGNLSSHLGKLERAGYVKVEKSYRDKVAMTRCRLTADGRDAFRQYSATLKAGP